MKNEVVAVQSAEKKYELVGGLVVGKNGARLNRIRALCDIEGTTVKKGDLGGLVESQDNLSHHGSAWIYDDAQVSGNAKVLDDAQVRDTALVYGRASVRDSAVVRGDARVFDNLKVTFPVSLTPIVIKGLSFPVVIWEDRMTIGKQSYGFQEWEQFSDEEIEQMHLQDFWALHKFRLLDLCRFQKTQSATH